MNEDHVFAELLTKQGIPSPIIACFFTGATPPTFCAPMPRLPEPPTGTTFDETFPAVLADALKVNRSIHDGAVMIGRARTDDAYRIIGWSYRLFPPPSAIEKPPNRGSAFNSCLEMAGTDSVDCIYLVSAGGVFRFERGAIRAVR